MIPLALANEITALVAEGILEPAGGLSEGRCGGPSESSSGALLERERQPASAGCDAVPGSSSGREDPDPWFSRSGNASGQLSMDEEAA